jgi:small-conductance mechanosensitive channel
VLIFTLWISSVIEARLLRSATGGELSLRLAASNATRALLMFVGLLIALSTVGINLSALSVLGGAVGVGVGFGLQKLAANYVSGFVILAERSMRIGDNVRVDNFEGRITQINARYTVIRSVAGRESIVPNEMLITSRVENLSLADSSLWQSVVVSVAYDSDVDLVMRLLKNASLNHARVLRSPEPSVSLSNFGSDGLEFTVGLLDCRPGKRQPQPEITHQSGYFAFLA